jgi:hypothetical protein
MGMPHDLLADDFYRCSLSGGECGCVPLWIMGAQNLSDSHSTPLRLSFFELVHPPWRF